MKFENAIKKMKQIKAEKIQVKDNDDINAPKILTGTYKGFEIKVLACKGTDGHLHIWYAAVDGKTFRYMKKATDFIDSKAL